MAQFDVDIAIVGGGFSGTMVAVHLLEQAKAPFSVAIVERRPAIGLGVAYGTTEASHLLNVPAAGMSAYPDRPTHFLDWLRTQPGFEEAAPTTFAPRRIYGRYLQAILERAEAGAPEGVRLLRVHDEAIGLEPTPSGARVHLASGRELEARRVVLALGNFPPADPKVPGAEAFYASERYIREPWAPGAIERIRPDEDVLLLGTGLTAIDWVMALAARGHRGTIHMLSRRGRLPQVHRPGLVPKTLTPPEPPYSASGLTRWVREEVGRAQAEGLDWRQAIDGVRPYVQGLWQGLPLDERRRFLRHARAHWEVRRHRMAPEVAEAIASLQTQGRLHVHAGRVTAYHEEPAGVQVSWPTGRTVVGHVVNCTGPETNVRRMRHSLLSALVAHGLIRPDSLEMGIEASALGAAMGSTGRDSAWLLTLGPSRKGALWETTAVPEIRMQAAALAQPGGPLLP